jgi:periplasmic protein TonB
MRPLNLDGSEVLMFEDSLVISQAAKLPTAKRWTLLGSTAVQAAIAATLVILPLLQPERLRFHLETPLVFTPPPPRPPLRVTEPDRAASSSTSLATPTDSRPITTLFPHNPSAKADDAPTPGPVNIVMGGGDGIPAALTGGYSHSTRVSVARPEPQKRIVISKGVSEGMLLSPIKPVYPAIARAAKISGIVVVEAVISKAGTIESLRVLSGPDMLRAAAVDAIRAARYRPYLLNGEPTEIQTTFTVSFRIGA